MDRKLKIVGSAILCWSASIAAASATTYKYTIFDEPGASSTFGFGVNDGGQIVGGTGTVGFVDTNGKFATLKVAGAQRTQGYGTCDIGRVTGFYQDAAGTFHGFVETSGSYTTLTAPNSTETFGFGINIMGEVVGSYNTTGASLAFKYFQGKYTTINIPEASSDGIGVQAHGINNRGQIVGFYGLGTDPTTGRNLVASFLDTNGKITTFQAPGAYATEADGINDNGDIVGTYSTLTGGAGFVLSHGVYSTVSVPGASLTEAQGINNHGEVVGWEITGGQIHGFKATPAR